MRSPLSRLVAIAIVVSANCVSASSVIAERWASSRPTYDVHAVASDRFSIENDQGHPVSKIAKFTVRAGDVFQSSTGERSEVVLGGWRETSQFRVFGNEGVEFYRVRVKIAPGWQSPDRNSHGHLWGTFFQLHGPNEYAAPPAVALHAEDKFGLFVLGGDLSLKVGGRRFLTNSDLSIGKWVDFVLKVKWATDSSGSISVFRRDEGNPEWEMVADIKSVATLQYRGSSEPKSHYWKAGFYRSESNHVNSLWLGPIIRAKSFAEATGQ